MSVCEKEFIVNYEIREFSRMLNLYYLYVRSFKKVFDNVDEIRFERKDDSLNIKERFRRSITLKRLGNRTNVHFIYEDTKGIVFKKLNEKAISQICESYQSQDMKKYIYKSPMRLEYQLFNSKINYINEIKELSKKKFLYIIEKMKEKEILLKIYETILEEQLSENMDYVKEYNTYNLILDTQKIITICCNYIISLIYSDEKLLYKAIQQHFGSLKSSLYLFKNENFTNSILKIDENKIDDIKTIIAPIQKNNPVETIAATHGLIATGLMFLTPLFVVPTTVIFTKKIAEIKNSDQNSKGVKWIKPFHMNDLNSNTRCTFYRLFEYSSVFTENSLMKEYGLEKLY